MSGGAGGAGDADLGPFPGDEDYFGQYVDQGVSCWLRVWVMCSVTIIVLMIPLSFTLLSYRAASRLRRNPTRATRPPPLPTQTEPDIVIDIDNLVLYDDAAGRPDNCSFSPNYRNVSAIDRFNVSSSSKAETLNLRRVFCVLDTLNLTTTFPYSGPYNFCTDIIVYSMYYDRTYKLRMKRRSGNTLGSGLPYNNFSTTHRGLTANLYATLGGSRADSADLATRPRSLTTLADDMRTMLRDHGYTGFNLDWDRPSNSCGTFDAGRYFTFLQLFDTTEHVLVTLPPDAKIIQRDYPLFEHRTIPAVKFIIVATHRLRPSGIVYCTGARIHAAAVFADIRKLLEPTYKDQLAYSIALGADLYLSKHKKLGAPAVPVSRFYDPMQGKMKLGYDAVCTVPAAVATSECILAATGEGSSDGYEVAAFAGVAELTERFRASHDDGMGRLPVVVYDIELDDHKNVCNFTLKPPLLAAIAGTGSI
ncbi:uncharacterized protein LOC144107520 [Amblyomma americanum]